MLAVRLDHHTESRVAELADSTGRSKSYYVREALIRYLDEMEDVYTALYRLEHPTAAISLEQMKQEFEDNVEG